MKNEDEIKILIEKILFKDISYQEREEIGERLNKIIPDPQWSNYIFYSDAFFKDEIFDYEGFIKKIFSYNPIIL
jgi:hypothetical protein